MFVGSASCYSWMLSSGRESVRGVRAVNAPSCAGDRVPGGCREWRHGHWQKVTWSRRRENPRCRAAETGSRNPRRGALRTSRREQCARRGGRCRGRTARHRGASRTRGASWCREPCRIGSTSARHGPRLEPKGSTARGSLDDRGAVDGDEGALAPATELVNLPGDELLARARFTLVATLVERCGSR